MQGRYRIDCVIRDWQVHHLKLTKEQLKSLRKTYPRAKPLIITGSVVNDKKGRWSPGFHMRSSIVVDLDRKKGIAKTSNSIYKLTGKEGNDVVPDLGNGVLGLFY